jgi:Ycf66 protein N-terminus
MVIFGLNSASVLAQINVGATPASFLGIFLAVAGAGLYFLRSVKPELARDYDIFFAAVGLLCGFILIFQGWRLDPILQFSQLLLVGSTVFFAYDSIRLRKIATEQAKRDTPIVDRERRVSDDYRYGGNNRRPYQAERMDADYESLPYYEDDEDGRPQRRITESRENRSSRSNREIRDDGYYDDDAPVNRSSRRSSSTSNNTDRSDTTSRGSSRRGASRPTSRNPERSDEEDWGTPSKPIEDDWENSENREEKRPKRRKDSSSESSSSSQRPSMYEDDVQVTPKAKRRRPVTDSTSKRERVNDDEMIPTTDYVDYKPIDRDEEPRNPVNFDDDTPIT